MFNEILLFVINIIAVVNCHPRPIVSTRYGTVEGITGSYIIGGKSFNYSAFLGIPFAEPPIGSRRFSLPVPYNLKWTSPYQATHFRDGCIQNPTDKVNFNISEDCLYLNIWRPQLNPNDSADELLPVYYHIHGSSFVKNSGATPDYQGEVLAATQKIITVNSNYRLGVFGFAYGSPDNMPGNVGIYDTLAVLEWIRDNIKSFGGDPDRVSLSGLSSGGKMSTIISSLPERFKVRSLFSRAIMMSGSSTDRHQVESPEIGVAKTRLLASKVNCLGANDSSSVSLSDKTIDCLRQRSASLLLNGQNSKDINAIGAGAEYPFLPVYGTQLIPDEPMVNHINNLGTNANVPMMFGFEQDESKPFPSIDAVKTLQDAYNYTKEEVTFAIKTINSSNIDSIFNIYFTNVDPMDTYDLRSRCIKLTSHVNFECPSLILAELFSLVSDNVYVYQNVYIGQTLPRPFGTQHGDDVKFGQGAPYREPESFTPADREYSSLLMKVYGDFVKGIPITEWPSIHLNKSDQFSLQNVKQLSLRSFNVLDPDQRVCMRWAKLFNYQIPKHS